MHRIKTVILFPRKNKQSSIGFGNNLIMGNVTLFNRPKGRLDKTINVFEFNRFNWCFKTYSFSFFSNFILLSSARLRLWSQRSTVEDFFSKIRHCKYLIILYKRWKKEKISRMHFVSRSKRSQKHFLQGCCATSWNDLSII